MVFNWFRRQHNEPSGTPSEDKQPETPAVQETQLEQAATSTAENATEVAVDLLAYAKAAYKNIQQRQQGDEQYVTPSDEATIDTVDTVDKEALLSQPSTDDQIQDELGVAPVEEAVTEAPEVESSESPLDIKGDSELGIDEGVATEPTVVPSEEIQPAAPATLSFLERAAAERQAKQERLIATAIEQPEPEVLQTAATTAPPEQGEIPGFAFDEGFLWSTEVLAAQGRRPEDISIEEITWLKKLRQGLDKTRRNILNQLKAIVGQGPLNQAAVTEIESLLLQADVGVEATDHIISTLQKRIRQEALPPEEGIAYLKSILRDMLDTPIQKSGKVSFAPEKETLNIWLMTGVNGVGKTTTIGKIAHLANKSGYKCLIGAADTFRAAAVEQVKIWGQRSGVEVIANPAKNADPAAVVFDAISAALARDTELLLVDTAGRLQNKKNLMDELSKVRRIIDKKAPNAKVESLLVLDATLGQNGLRQAEVFSQAAQLSGVVLTKLDGTAKGGVALAVVQQLGLPIRFIGAGEGVEDLRPFSSYEFVEALLSG
ncbi:MULTISPECIES: signal recognition particle-docking protein FtsY [Nostocales]|uniref:Signal recognition particle receptor FtsY n=3 Tax=Nostocales TaxID=1161 RepID=A0A0C1R0G2_9CYAN|nr:signal recognition particle-docking protein FtsY [Tolypothrix bouteillei]KAF3887151.1 signal recognition particle-docking protein FtsY [Tolypothrix bouteillei VB521301]